MRVVICGAGIAGLALGNLLSERDWDVTIVDRAPAPRTAGYMVDFFGLGYDAAERMGLLPRLTELGYDVPGANFVDNAGRVRARLSYERFARAVDGKLLSIMRPDLELALRERLPDAVDLRYATTVSAIDERESAVAVGLSDGSDIEADLLVGADGIHSAVRGMMFGDEQRFFRYLGMQTAAYTFDAPEVHAQLGDSFALTETSRRMMGCYALRDGTVAVFATHYRDDPALPGDIPAFLRAEYGSLGWIVPTALARMPEAHEVYYDQVAQVDVPQWSTGRVTLIGDACQAVSLLAGQGASLAMAGAYVLAACLADASSVTGALRRYETHWRPVVVEKQAAGRRGAEWFLPTSRARVYARRVMLGLAVLPGMESLLGSSLVGKNAVRLDDLSAERLTTS